MSQRTDEVPPPPMGYPPHPMMYPHYPAAQIYPPPGQYPAQFSLPVQNPAIHPSIQQQHPAYAVPYSVPFQYPTQYETPYGIPAQEAQLPGPIIPGQPQGYALLELDTTTSNENAHEVPVQPLTFGQRLKVLPLHMLYACTGQVSHLRKCKNNATGGLVLFLYALLLGYEIFLQTFICELSILAPIVVVGCFLFQACIFAMFGACMHGRNLGTNPFVQFLYTTGLFALPIAILGTLQLIPDVAVIFILMALAVFSIILYIFPLQAVYDVTVCKAVSIVLFYLLLVIGLLSLVIYYIAANWNMSD